ncbi:MAG: hypothetical protein CMJ18_20040 [Phycisphaeraceae bacterium]|nr:hypothetical protein [Phycisphaeraceae bacterium]
MIRIQYQPNLSQMPPDLSDDAWSNLAWHDDFTVPGPGRADLAQVVSPSTAFAMAHDEQMLLIAVKCGAVPGGAPDDLEHERVHIMFDAEGEGRRAAKFIGNSDGAVSATACNEGGADDRWPGDVGFDARIGKEQWTAVLKVPLRQLHHGGEAAGRPRINVARLVAVPEYWLCFPRMPGTKFWEPHHAIGEAVFERPELLAAFAWDVRCPARARLMQDGGATVCRQQVRATNLSTQTREVELRAAFRQPGRDPVGHTRRRVRMEPGASHVEVLDLPVPEPFNYGFVGVDLHEPDSGRHESENRFLVEADPLSWKPHFIRRGDGRGGCTCDAAQMQLMPLYEGRLIAPYGLAAMGDGRIVCVGIAWGTDQDQPEQALVTLSDDEGATWGEYIALPGIHCRPVMLAYLGRGVVTFEAGDTTERFRMFSHDYGRTWDERINVPPAPTGQPLGFEGNPLVERDSDGNAVSLVQIGQTLEGAAPHWKINEYVRWSRDGGRTWPRVVRPEPWHTTETYAGETYDVGASEGSLVRAANGDLVAALRTFSPTWFAEHPYYQDSLEGTAVSISKDDGATWSPMQTVFESGRHHANLVRLPDDDLVMTVIRRVDFHGNRLAGYRRGCDAVVSHDHGATWDVEHLIVIDDFPYCRGGFWIDGQCGHLCSELLSDGSILTGYGNYLAGGVLVRWRP